MRGDFVSTVEKAVGSGMQPPAIDLEITETYISDDIIAARLALDTGDG